MYDISSSPLPCLNEGFLSLSFSKWPTDSICADFTGYFRGGCWKVMKLLQMLWLSNHYNSGIVARQISTYVQSKPNFPWFGDDKIPFHEHVYGKRRMEWTKTDVATAKKLTPRRLHFTHSLRWHHSNVAEHYQHDGRLSLQFTPANQWAAGAQWGNRVGNAQLFLHQQTNKKRGVILDDQGPGNKRLFLFLFSCLLAQTMLADWQLEHLQGSDGHETLPSRFISINNKQLQWWALMKDLETFFVREF